MSSVFEDWEFNDGGRGYEVKNVVTKEDAECQE